jgi:hypothetical protein
VEVTGIHALDTALVWGGAMTVLADVVGTLWRALRFSVASNGSWTAGPARRNAPGCLGPGVLARLAGFEERLMRVEHELYLNSGQSLRDAVDRANSRLARLCSDLDDPEPPRQTRGQ